MQPGLAAPQTKRSLTVAALIEYNLFYQLELF